MAIGHPRYGALVAPSSRATHLLAVPPTQRCRERAARDAELIGACGLLPAGVGRRAFPAGERPTLRQGLVAQVLAAGAARRDDPVVAIDVSMLAGHGLLRDVIGSGERHLLPASIRLPVGLAGLPRFGASNAE